MVQVLFQNHFLPTDYFITCYTVLTWLDYQPLLISGKKANAPPPNSLGGT